MREEKRCVLPCLLCPVGMGAESKETPQHLVCYRAGDESGGLGLEERKETEGLELAHLLYSPT